MNRPTDNELLAYLLHGANGESSVEEAAKQNANVRRRLNELSQVVAALRDAPRLEAMFWVSDESVSRVAAATCPQCVRHAGAEAIEVVRRVARVILDSFTGPEVALSLRGGGGSRRIVAEAEGLRLDFELTPTHPAVAGVTAGAIHVLGRVESSGSALEVTAERGGEAVARADVDGDGFFEMSLSPGIYDVVCRFGGVEAAVEGLDLRV